MNLAQCQEIDEGQHIDQIDQAQVFEKILKHDSHVIVIGLRLVINI